MICEGREMGRTREDGCSYRGEGRKEGARGVQFSPASRRGKGPIRAESLSSPRLAMTVLL